MSLKYWSIWITTNLSKNGFCKHIIYFIKIQDVVSKKQNTERKWQFIYTVFLKHSRKQHVESNNSKPNYRLCFYTLTLKVAPLYFQCNLWRNMEGGGKLKYSNYCSHNILRTMPLPQTYRYVIADVICFLCLLYITELSLGHDNKDVFLHSAAVSTYLTSTRRLQRRNYNLS